MNPLHPDPVARSVGEQINKRLLDGGRDEATSDVKVAAVALVSGRAVSDVDRLFAPLVLPAAGQHGAERRSATTSATNAPSLW